MKNYRMLKDQLLDLRKRLSELITNTAAASGLKDQSLSDWENRCEEIGRQLTDERIRVAVVGAIKSGKSTFVNSLFGGDYLKRGAGVITSIVTRARRGDALTAKLYFKSWDDINTEVIGAMVLLPSTKGGGEKDRFDIRRKQNRTMLQTALDALGADQWITDETRNISGVLLSSYLKGYDAVKDMVGLEAEARQYAADEFGEHRAFVGSDALAVYLKDVEIEINSGDLDRRIEIADCQGSDSSNPLHLTAIQDYLLKTHLIVYVVSSRTGIRQADIKFLSMIKKMGVVDNILFVVNCDFSEHDAAEDLTRLIRRIREEVSLIIPDPPTYTLSALYNLFSARKENLSQKDRQRFSQWQKEKALVAISEAGIREFTAAFHRRVTAGRSGLLLKSTLDRLGSIAGGFEDWVRINHEIFSRDAEGAAQIIERIRKHKTRIDGIKSMIKSTLDGAVQKLKKELKTEIDSFFDSRYGTLMEDLRDQIRGFKVSAADYRERLERGGFSGTLFLVFQEFRQALDVYMAETVNPEAIRFILSQEKHIQDYLGSIVGPYDVMVRDALAEYNSGMGKSGIALHPDPLQPLEMPDMDTIKEIAGLTLPPASAVMHYSARIKTEATVRLGFYSAATLLRRLLKKPEPANYTQQMLALKDGVVRMRRETERSVIDHFKDHKENIKFQYVFKLADALAGSLYRLVIDRFRSCDSDLSTLLEQIAQRQGDKHQVSALLKEQSEAIRTVCTDMDRLMNRIEQLNGALRAGS